MLNHKLISSLRMSSQADPVGSPQSPRSPRAPSQQVEQPHPDTAPSDPPPSFPHSSSPRQTACPSDPIQAFTQWKEKTLNRVVFIREVLSQIYKLFLDKEAVNKARLAFMKKYLQAVMTDMAGFSSSQLDFANKTLPSLEAKGSEMGSVFEQGIIEMLKGVKENDHKVLGIKKKFQSEVIDKLNKTITSFDNNKNGEFTLYLNKIAQKFDTLKTLNDKSEKEFNELLLCNQKIKKCEAKGKKCDGDLFHESFKYTFSMNHTFGVLNHICEDLLALQPFAIKKENEYLKTFAACFKSLTLFTQEHFGPLMSVSISKSKLIFDMVD